MRAHTVPVVMISLVLLLPGCAAQTPFPPKVVENVAPIFDFAAWRDASPTNPSGKSDSGTKVQLGGRIVQATPKNGTEVLIIGEQLPIASRPVYGPMDASSRTGDYEFVIVYPGEVDTDALRTGNRFVVVGVTKGRKSVVVNGAAKSEPLLMADCIHIWRSAGAETAALKEGAGDAKPAMAERTYCAKHK